MPKLKDSCVKPARGPIAPAIDSAAPAGTLSQSQEVRKMLARVGKEAPDFEATAFVRDEGFKPVKLSDYKGKVVMLDFWGDW